MLRIGAEAMVWRPRIAHTCNLCRRDMGREPHYLTRVERVYSNDGKAFDYRLCLRCVFTDDIEPATVDFVIKQFARQGKDLPQEASESARRARQKWAEYWRKLDAAVKERKSKEAANDESANR